MKKIRLIARLDIKGENVVKDNVYGCQFHPERSEQAGLKILQEFLDSF